MYIVSLITQPSSLSLEYWILCPFDERKCNMFQGMVLDCSESSGLPGTYYILDRAERCQVTRPIGLFQCTVSKLKTPSNKPTLRPLKCQEIAN